MVTHQLQVERRTAKAHRPKTNALPLDHATNHLFVCLFVFLLSATLRQNFRMDLRVIFREGWQWANEEMIKFWWRYGSRIWIRIRTWIATLVRRALAEVCTISVLLVMVALCNRADHYIFILFLLSSSSFFFSSPNLSGRKLDVYHTLAHGVALVRI